MRARASRLLTKAIVFSWAVYIWLEGAFTQMFFHKRLDFPDRLALMGVATVVALLLFGVVCLVLGPPGWPETNRSGH
jgi:hypothetical protein